MTNNQSNLFAPALVSSRHCPSSPKISSSSMALREAFLSLKYRPINPSPSRNTTRIVAVNASTANSGARQRRPQNAAGEFFVDHRCIDCDTCRWMAPQTFVRIEDKSAVAEQPSCEEERIKALQALLACPTSSIHTEKPAKEILKVHELFPLPIDEQKLPGVFHCGYHSEISYGATSYLIVHPEGNILVDSPRYVEILARKIEKLGGARYMFLTHKDDIGDHEKWAKRLNCKRILHSGDIQDSTADVEMQLYGDGPWSINTDIELFHTPGHTAGSVCLYYKPLKALFTGDHFFKSEDSELSISLIYNQLSVSMQLDNIRKLLDLDFVWILPGHGRRAEFRDNQEKNSAIEAFLALSKQAHA